MELHSENIRCTVISLGAVESELKNGTPDPSSAAFVKDLYEKIAIPADSVACAVLYAIEQPADGAQRIWWHSKPFRLGRTP
jgi:NADP-dependent 3-hydroxy acid dehydrogenase YdfG